MESQKQQSEDSEESTKCLAESTKNIIKISTDDDEPLKLQNLQIETNKLMNENDFLKRFRDLTLPHSAPLVADDMLIERFHLSRYEDGNPPKRYIQFFYCNKYNEEKVKNSVGEKCYQYTILSAPVISGRQVMIAVRKRFSDQKWIRKDTFELPVKSKLGHCELQRIVSECLDLERTRMYEYIQFLVDSKNNRK